MGAQMRGLVLAVAMSAVSGAEEKKEGVFRKVEMPHRPNNVYPDGVFPPMGTSTKLTAETFPDFVEDALVDEKTAIVRFIAGEG